MYERFTDRARKAMQLANETAQKYGHEYIGTEHILIGCLREGSGVMCHYLRENGFSTDSLLAAARTACGPEVYAAPPTFGRLPHTPRAKRIVEFAMCESVILNHNYVGTEHLLLGMLREPDGAAGLILRNAGISLDGVRAWLVKATKPSPAVATPPILSRGELVAFRGQLKYMMLLVDGILAKSGDGGEQLPSP